MFGPPKDVEGECNAHLYLADDFGDNMCTIKCQKPPGHEGEHREEFERHGTPVIITWWVDERDEKDAWAKLVGQSIDEEAL